MSQSERARAYVRACERAVSASTTPECRRSKSSATGSERAGEDTARFGVMSLRDGSEITGRTSLATKGATLRLWATKLRGASSSGARHRDTAHPKRRPGSQLWPGLVLVAATV